MTGPRDYTVGTEAALLHLSRGLCYFPGCTAPVVTFVEGQPVFALQRGHIYGAYPNSARYDPGMTDEQRASFDNLILLCKPHHDLVDRLKPDDYPPELLKTWKSDREGDGIEALRGLTGLTEIRLAEMLEEVVRNAPSPQRSVVVEMHGGTMVDGGVATFPIVTWHDLIRHNPDLAGERVVVTIVRNTGSVAASVDSVAVYMHTSAQAELTLLGRNDYLELNPTLGGPLAPGSSFNWLTSLETLQMIVDATAATTIDVTGFSSVAHLGSGESVTMEPIAIEHFPFRRNG